MEPLGPFMAREVANSQRRVNERLELRREEHEPRRKTPRWCDIPTVEEMAAIAAATGNDRLKRHVTALRSYAKRYIGSGIPAAVDKALQDVRQKGGLPERPVLAAVASAPVLHVATASVLSQRFVEHKNLPGGYTAAAVDKAWYRVIPPREVHAASFYYWHRPG